MLGKLYRTAKSEIEHLLSSFKREGSTVKNFSYLISGKLFIVLLMFVSTPLLTRLYTPEEYGYFSFLNALALNFSIFASLGYPLAMIVAPSSKEFYNLLALSLLLMIIALFIMSGVIITWSDWLIPFSGTIYTSADYASLLLFSSLVFSLMNVFSRWNTWQNQFQQGATINLLVNFGSRGTSLCLGFLGNYPLGLVIGELTGKIFGLIVNFKLNFFREWREIQRVVSWDETIYVFKKYKNYPRYVLTSNYLISLMGQLPVFIFPFFFESRVLGSYSLALGLMNLPGLLIATPLSSIYMKKLSVLRENEETQVPVFVKKLLSGLVLFSIIPFVIMTAWSTELFTLLFGQEWVLAGTFGGILAIYGMFELLQLSLQSVMLVYNKERELFRYSLLQITLVLILFVPGILRAEPVESILGYSIARLIGSLIVIGNSLSVSKIKPWPALLKICFMFALLFLSFKGLSIIMF